MQFETKIDGIPCICSVTRASVTRPARLNGHPDRWLPEEGGDFEFEILDRKGYEAPWLERKMGDSDNERLYQEFIERLNA